MTLSPNTQIFFVGKLRKQKLSHFFNKKSTEVFEILTFEILMKR